MYSLGLMLYGWLLGQAAFDGSDALELAYRQISVAPPAPHAVNAGVPLQVSELVMRLLVKSPDTRYASARGLADDLQRCLQQLRTQGAVSHFVLGGTDLRTQFVIPDQLYGRACEMAALVRLWRSTVNGGLQLCLVRGDAGMGKTALVRALRNTVLASGGMLVETRFEAQPPERPYVVLIDAFKILLRQVLAGAQAERARWRTRLLSALGKQLAVLQEALPEMEWITGRLPPAPLLVGLAAQQRLDAALMELLLLFAGPEHPLLLFLDDLQWADAASLNFLRAVLGERRSSHLLFLGACQDRATNTDCPLTHLLKHLHKSHTSPSEIRLTPLSAEEVAALIDDTCLHLKDLPALTRLVMQETQGNPRATRQFLQGLVTQGRLRYEPLSKGWRWSPEEGPARSAKLWWT
jgi:predicted ATPase